MCKGGVAQGSCESDSPALPAAQTCQGHSLRGVVSPPNALNAHLRSIVHCSFYTSRRVEEAGKLHCIATFALQLLLCIRLFARCYSSTSLHSKRVDARFARRTVYRPPSGEFVMVLMR